MDPDEDAGFGRRRRLPPGGRARRTGDVRDHDQEVNEARWVAIDEAQGMLAFSGGKKILERAAHMIEALS